VGRRRGNAGRLPVHLLCAWEPDYAAETLAPLVPSIEDDCQALLDRAAAQARAVSPRLDIHGSTVHAQPASALIAASRDADTVIVGSRGLGSGKGSARRVDVDAGRVTCIVSGGRRERGGRRAGRRPANRGRRRRLRPVHGGDGVCVQAGLPAWSTTLWKKRSRDPVAEDFVGRLAGHRGASGRRRRHHSCNRARPGRS